MIPHVVLIYDQASSAIQFCNHKLQGLASKQFMNEGSALQEQLAHFKLHEVLPGSAFESAESANERNIGDERTDQNQAGYENLWKFVHNSRVVKGQEIVFKSKNPREYVQVIA